MKITFRAIDRIQLTLLEVAQDERDLVANEPIHFTPLDLRGKRYEVDRGLQDMAVFYRGDTVPLEVTLLDFRGNPHPGVATATAFEMGFAQITPIRQQLFILSGTLVDAPTGRVDFIMDAVNSDQIDVDEAIGNVRITVGGVFTTFEVFSTHFKDSAFALPS